MKEKCPARNRMRASLGEGLYVEIEVDKKGRRVSPPFGAAARRKAKRKIDALRRRPVVVGPTLEHTRRRGSSSPVVIMDSAAYYALHERAIRNREDYEAVNART